MNNRTAPYAMVMLTILFGLKYVSTKIIADLADPIVILFFANLLGFLILTCVIFVKKISLKVDYKFIFFINMLYLFTHLVEFIGIKYTTSSNASFIIQLSVLLIPIVSAFVEKRKPSLQSILLGLLALFGLGIMTLDFTTFTLNLGDWLCMFATLMFSFYVVFIGKIDEKRNNILAIVFYYFLLGSILNFSISLVRVGLSGIHIPIGNPRFLIAFLAFSLIVVAATLIQVEIAKHIRSDTMALYYCLEPITTVIAAYFLLSEVLTLQVAIGGLIVIIAILTPTIILKFKQTKKGQ